jgi:hypothetical protein
VLHLLLSKATEHVYFDYSMQDKLTPMLKGGASNSRWTFEVYPFVKIVSIRACLSFGVGSDSK